MINDDDYIYTRKSAELW